MRITMVALGTRGDVQPAIALGRGLQAAGHAVTLVAGENFRAWVQSYGLGFVPTLDMEALMRSVQGVAWVESPNPLTQLQHMRRLVQANGAQMYTPMLEQASEADLLISGFVSSPFVQSISEKFGIPQINTPLQPYLPTRSGPASMTALVKTRESIVNRWMSYFTDRLMWSVAAVTVNDLRTTKLALPPHSPASYIRVSHIVSAVCGFSRYVVPEPPDWGANQHVAGYWFLDEGQHYQPPADLSRFLESGAPPHYIGFGSMSSGTPEETVKIAAEALRRTGQRGIIASGWSGASENGLPENVLLVDLQPHEWLFERVAGVVHHGGAGTTAAGLRAGKPTLIIPHFSDQPYWARRVYELGVGAKPIPRHRLTAENLADGIDTLVSDRKLTEAAAQLGAKIRAERGVETAVAMIEQLVAVTARPPRA